MKNLTTKTKTITSVGLAFVLIIAISCYTIYRNNANRTKYLNGFLAGINNQEDNFYSEDTKESKLDTLTSLENDYQDYLENATFKGDEVNEKYQDDIQMMKQYFKDEYSQAIADNSASDLNSINDKNQIDSYIANLNNTLKNITDNNEECNVCDSDETNNLNGKINDLVTNYQGRIKAIDDKAAADAKAAQEAEAAKQQQAASQANNNNQTNNNSNSKTSSQASNGSTSKSNNTTSSSSNTKSSGTTNSTAKSGSTSNNTTSAPSSSHGSYTESWILDDNGNKKPGSTVYRYQDGLVTDENGNDITRFIN